MLNRFVTMGRFTAHPELKTMPSGAHVVSFSLAVQRDRKNREGGRDTDFFDCVAYDQKADFICQHFHKGDAAIVDGRLETRTWQGKDGTTRKGIDVVVQNIYFGAANKSETTAPAPAHGYAPQQGYQQPPQSYQQQGFAAPSEYSSGTFDAISDEDGLPF